MTKLEDSILGMKFRMILTVKDDIQRCGITDLEGMKKLYERNMDFKLLCDRLHLPEDDSY